MKSITIDEKTPKAVMDELIAEAEKNESYDYSGLPLVEVEAGTYMVATSEKEADEALEREIYENLDEYDHEFLSKVTGLPGEDFENMSRYGVQEAIKASCGMDKFIEEAKKVSDRGDELAKGDGTEIRLECGYFAFKMD